MTVANVTAKRLSDNVIFQATGDTPFSFTGLGSNVEFDLTMPDGSVLRRTTLAAPNLIRLSSTQVINNDDNQTSYTSPSTFTRNANANLIVAVVTLFVPSNGATSLDVRLGDTAFTQAFLSITRGGSGRSFGVYFLNASEIPSGVNTVTVGGLVGQTPADMRACQVEMIQFSGASQANPLYFGTASTFFSNVFDNMTTQLTMQSVNDQHIGLFIQTPGGATTLPATTNRTLLRAAQTGFAISTSMAVLISASVPNNVGASTHNGSMMGNGQVTSISFGVRAA